MLPRKPHNARLRQGALEGGVLVVARDLGQLVGGDEGVVYHGSATLGNAREHMVSTLAP